MNQREDVFGAGEALQLPGADLGQPGPSRKLVGYQLGGRRQGRKIGAANRI